MRAYSQSQQKFIDIPDTTSATTGGALSDYDTLRKTMLFAALSDVKNASKYSSIANIMKPTAAESASKQAESEVKNIVGPLQTLKNVTKTGIKSYNDYVSFRTQRNLISQSVAKLIERNRLSDTDRTFYLSNFPSFLEMVLVPSAAKTKLDTVDEYLRQRVGQNVETEAYQKEESNTPTSFIEE